MCETSQKNHPTKHITIAATSPFNQRQVCGADWSPSGLLARVAADGAFHALIDTGAEKGQVIWWHFAVEVEMLKIR